MTTIFLKTCLVIAVEDVPGDQNERLARYGAFFVHSRPFFNCLAPRIEEYFLLASEQRIGERALRVASRAGTFHLALTTAEARFLHKLTQVQRLHLVHLCSLPARLAEACVIGSHLARLAFSLESLNLRVASDPELYMAELAPFIAQLHNLRELIVDFLTPELCKAVADGPGHRLRKLKAESACMCSATDFQTLFSGCSDLHELDLLTCGLAFCILPLVSQLRYLRQLNCRGGALVKCRGQPELSLTTMQQCLQEMPCLTELRDWSSRSVIATAIATTVGSQLRVLHLLFLAELASDVFVLVCCAASFPQLEDLYLRGSLGKSSCVVDAKVTVSLSTRLERFFFYYCRVTARSLTQLLTDKPRLRHVDFTSLRVEHSCIDAALVPEEEDWFGQFVKCPVQEMWFGAILTRGCRPSRIGQLARTLTDATVHFDSWPGVVRDRFLGAMLSECVLLKTISVSLSGPPVCGQVAFAGLRNNEKLQSLELADQDLSDSARDVLFEELMAMRSTELRDLLPSCRFSDEQDAQLDRFVHLGS